VRAFALAEFNIARLKVPISDPIVAEFVAQLDDVNALAEQSPGFLWRMKVQDGSANYVVSAQCERTLLNLSVWETLEALKTYVYRSHHGVVYRDRGKWFEPSGKSSFVLWWVPNGHIPSIDEGQQRLNMLRQLGPTSEAFDFKVNFPAPAIHAATTI